MAPIIVEYAKTGRSKCKGECKDFIKEGELRIGVKSDLGEYSMTAWRCADCFTDRQRSNLKKSGQTADDIEGLDSLKAKDRTRALKVLGLSGGGGSGKDSKKKGKKRAAESDSESSEEEAPKKGRKKVTPAKKKPAKKKKVESESESESESEEPPKKSKKAAPKKSTKKKKVEESESESESESEEPPKKSKKKSPAKKGGSSKALKGKTLCFTGALNFLRAKAKSAAEKAGARVTTGVSGNTDIVVAGPGAGSKLATAKGYGCEIWTEEEFTDAVGGL